MASVQPPAAPLHPAAQGHRAPSLLLPRSCRACILCCCRKNVASIACQGNRHSPKSIRPGLREPPLTVECVLEQFEQGRKCCEPDRQPVSRPVAPPVAAAAPQSIALQTVGPTRQGSRCPLYRRLLWPALRRQPEDQHRFQHLLPRRLREAPAVLLA